MKKLFFLLVIISFSFGMVFSESIEVTSPHSGDTWYKGDPYTITWTKSGTQHARVKIRLFNSAGTTKILDITNGTPNDGRFGPWTLPDSVPDGSYIVRVKTLDDLVSDNSEVFSIAGEPGVEPEPDRTPCFSINFTEPEADGGTTWYYGNRNLINWRRSVSLPCSIPGMYKLELRNESDSRTILTIVERRPLLVIFSEYPWIIPNSVPQGTYRIKFTANSITSTSGPFKISFPVLSSPVLTELNIIDLKGRITNRELKVAYMKSFRWRIKCKVRISVTPEASELRNVLVNYSLHKVGGTERYSNSYTISNIHGGEDNVHTINLECGDKGSKKKRPRLESGDYRLRIEIDPGNTQRDRNRANNIILWRFTLKR